MYLYMVFECGGRSPGGHRKSIHVTLSERCEEWARPTAARAGHLEKLMYENDDLYSSIYTICRYIYTFKIREPEQCPKEKWFDLKIILYLTKAAVSSAIHLSEIYIYIYRYIIIYSKIHSQICSRTDISWTIMIIIQDFHLKKKHSYQSRWHGCSPTICSDWIYS